MWEAGRNWLRQFLIEVPHPTILIYWGEAGSLQAPLLALNLWTSLRRRWCAAYLSPSGLRIVAALIRKEPRYSELRANAPSRNLPHPPTSHSTAIFILLMVLHEQLRRLPYLVWRYWLQLIRDTPGFFMSFHGC